MYKADIFNDYYFINHRQKKVTFSYKSYKRHKTKVLNYIKKHRQESDIIKYLNTLNLDIKKITTNKYIHYYIIDKSN